MLAWLGIAIQTIQNKILQVLIAVIAIIAALINAKSYFKEKDGCKVVDTEKRIKI
jgi:fumarate reductase subunit C